MNHYPDGMSGRDIDRMEGVEEEEEEEEEPETIYAWERDERDCAYVYEEGEY